MDNASSHGRWYEDACGAAFSMELLGERWSMLIVREMMLGPRRFSGLRASLPGLSAKVLTERLTSLEESGLVVRRKLPPPASVQVYELTEFGRMAEEPLLALCRWSSMSPMHNPRLPLSPTALMLSLKAMFQPERAAGFALTAAVRVGGEGYCARVESGAIAVARGETPQADCAFDTPLAFPVIGLLFGKRDRALMEQEGLVITGDRQLALRFADCFALPPKLGG